MFLYLLIAFVSVALFLYFGIPKVERPSLFSLIGQIMSESKTPHGFEISGLSVGSLFAGGIAMFILFQSNQTNTAEPPPNHPISETASIVQDSPPQSSALSFRNETGCTQLGEIAANAFSTREDGHSLATVLANLRKVNIPEPQRREAAEGVVIAIYGDASIGSRAEAYKIAYATCKG